METVARSLRVLPLLSPHTHSHTHTYTHTHTHTHTQDSLMSGVVGCEHYTLAHQVEHFGGVVILTCRQAVGQLDLNRLPKLRWEAGLLQVTWQLVCVCVRLVELYSCPGGSLIVRLLPVHRLWGKGSGNKTTLEEDLPWRKIYLGGRSTSEEDLPWRKIYLGGRSTLEEDLPWRNIYLGGRPEGSWTYCSGFVVSSSADM